MARPTDKGLISKSKLTAIADQIRRLFGVTNKFTMDGCEQKLSTIFLNDSTDLSLWTGGDIYVFVPSGFYLTDAKYSMKKLLAPTPTISKELSAGFGMKVTAVSDPTENGYLLIGQTSNPATTYIKANDFAQGDLSITQNGTYNTIQDADKFYKTVTVNVPQPLQFDTWTLNGDLNNGLSTALVAGEVTTCYAPILMYDGSLVTSIKAYYNDTGSTDEGYLDFYFSGINEPTRIYEISGYSGSWTQSQYQGKTIQVPSFVRQFNSDNLFYPQKTYANLYKLLKKIASLKV